MSLSGQYTEEYNDANGFVELKVSAIDRVVIRVSDGKWHGVDLPTNVTKVLPKLRAPLACGKKNNVAWYSRTSTCSRSPNSHAL